MPAPDPFASLTPGSDAAAPVGPRNVRRKTSRSGQSGARSSRVWPLLGLVGGAAVAGAVRLPLAVLPLVGTVTYAQDNAPRAWAVLTCGALAGVLCLGRWFRPALVFSGAAAGLLAASALDQYRDFQALRDSTHLAPGAGEMAREAAASTAKMLAALRPEAGAFLLPAGCLLGIVAALWGGRRRDEEMRQ